jgi:hypothetical protein
MWFVRPTEATDKHHKIKFSGLNLRLTKIKNNNNNDNNNRRGGGDSRVRTGEKFKTNNRMKMHKLTTENFVIVATPGLFCKGVGYSHPCRGGVNYALTPHYSVDTLN